MTNEKRIAEEDMLAGIAKDIANIKEEASDIAKAKRHITELATKIESGDFDSDTAQSLCHYASYLKNSMKRLECWADAIDNHLEACRSANYRELRWERTLNMLVQTKLHPAVARHVSKFQSNNNNNNGE